MDLVHLGGHSASEEAHFRHFQSVSETVSFVFSVNLIHILNLFWPIWIPLGKYGQFMAIRVFHKNTFLRKSKVQPTTH